MAKERVCTNMNIRSLGRFSDYLAFLDNLLLSPSVRLKGQLSELNVLPPLPIHFINSRRA